MSARPPRRGHPLGRGTLLCLTVLGMLLAEPALSPRHAAAGTLPADVVPAVSRAFTGLPGELAVVVAPQHSVRAGLGVRALTVARTVAAAAGNGALADRPFPTASMVKLFLADDVLHRARAGELRLRPDDPELLRRMITASDDSAASTLWVRYDGERAVRDVARRYALRGTAPPRVPGQWGRTTTTARDLARFLSLLPVVAHPDDAARLLGWMRGVTPRAADGFDQRFGMFGLAGGVAVKQGWMCCPDGRRHVHSVGVVGRTVVVLLTAVPREVTYDQVREALTAAAAQVRPPRRP